MMKPVKLIMFAAMMLAACQTKPKDGRTDTYNSGSVAIAADAGIQPILEEERAVFEALNPAATLRPKYVNEVESINLLLRDSVRLVIAGRRLTSQETVAMNNRKFFPQEIPLATDGLAVIVNRQNPDTLISVTNLRRILTGEVRCWSDLYPHSPLGNFTLVFDHPNSGTVRFAIDSICRGEPFDRQQVKAVEHNLEVINYVKHTPSAIGIVGVNWLSDRNDSTGLSFYREVRVMSVSRAAVPTPQNSYKPYQAYLYNGNYPLTRTLYLLLNDPRNGLSCGFANFLSGSRGQRIILKSGLVPATQPVRLVEVNN
jgi:phosphate transport system substrate-binding protein